jgi:hypothetical protein
MKGNDADAQKKGIRPNFRNDRSWVSVCKFMIMLTYTVELGLPNRRGQQFRRRNF